VACYEPASIYGLSFAAAAAICRESRAMMRLIIGLLATASLSWALTQAARAGTTTYILPKHVHWIADTVKGVPLGDFYAVLRGKYSDKCDQIIRVKFPNGFVYPWHTNDNFDAIYTVIEGTLVIGFDKHHAKSAEWVLPTGSVMQGLGSEPHYGRAIGETIFDVYFPCKSY
jgi:hypothetical protein